MLLINYKTFANITETRSALITFFMSVHFMMKKMNYIVLCAGLFVQLVVWGA